MLPMCLYRTKHYPAAGNNCGYIKNNNNNNINYLQWTLYLYQYTNGQIIALIHLLRHTILHRSSQHFEAFLLLMLFLFLDKCALCTASVRRFIIKLSMQCLDHVYLCQTCITIQFSIIFFCFSARSIMQSKFYTVSYSPKVSLFM